MDIKQTAIEQLTKAEKFILICDDEKQKYYGIDGIGAYEAIGMIEDLKFKILMRHNEDSMPQIFEDKGE